MGYWFVLIVYESGRVAYSRRRFKSKETAQDYADKLKDKYKGVKRTRTCYIANDAEIDVKKLI
ncbi:MAG: hypothetical protein K2I30_05585 [Clostridia bacterium]|nr:hypothetical protein [Clostridia bacterium]